VLDATEEYFAEEDTLQQWLDECTQDGGEFAFSRTAELFASWKEWCEARNFTPGTSRGFSDELVDRDYKRKKGTKGVRGFHNLTLSR
jgi:putative DNA primase/helicase